MENRSKENTGDNVEPGKSRIESPGSIHEKNKGSNMNYQERKKELHSKILQITMTIKDMHPELSQYLEEMNETIPDEKDPELVLMDLKSYYDSLVAMLNKYKEEHPQ